MPRIQTTSDLINSLPALVGYVPAGAIILITTGPDTDVLDVQFAITAAAQITTTQAANLPELCGLNAQNTPGAVLVAVCGDWLADHVRDVLDHLRDALTSLGITVRQRITTTTLEVTRPWTDIDTDETGMHVAYTDSLATAQAVAAGTRIAPTRHSVVREFDELDPAAPPLAVTDDPIVTIQTCERIAEAISGELMPPLALIAQAAQLITTNESLRDVMVLLGLDHPAQAAQLWTAMAAHMRGRARIEALTIAAALYYSGRDALRATVALEVADQLGVELDIALPKLGQMLTIALARAISPDEVITILRSTIDTID